MRFCTASTVSTASTAPAPPSRWPIIDFVAETMASEACGPSRALIASDSGTSPTGVDVACALMWRMSAGCRPAVSRAWRIARIEPRPSGSPAVMWYESFEMPQPPISA